MGSPSGIPMAPTGHILNEGTIQAPCRALRLKIVPKPCGAACKTDACPTDQPSGGWNGTPPPDMGPSVPGKGSGRHPPGAPTTLSALILPALSNARRAVSLLAPKPMPPFELYHHVVQVVPCVAGTRRRARGVLIQRVCPGYRCQQHGCAASRGPACPVGPGQCRVPERMQWPR
jgi:hypothetical protein